MIDFQNSCEQLPNPRFAILLENRSFELFTAQVQEYANQKEELERIRNENQALDKEISGISRKKVVDHGLVQRLRKQKLELTAKISQHSQERLPDIIA